MPSLVYVDRGQVIMRNTWGSFILTSGSENYSILCCGVRVSNFRVKFSKTEVKVPQLICCAMLCYCILAKNTTCL